MKLKMNGDDEKDNDDVNEHGNIKIIIPKYNTLYREESWWKRTDLKDLHTGLSIYKLLFKLKKK